MVHKSVEVDAEMERIMKEGGWGLAWMNQGDVSSMGSMLLLAAPLEPVPGRCGTLQVSVVSAP